MMTIGEVSRRTGVSVRALRYYGAQGLLPPAEVTEAGYRLYDGAALERLQQILLFRELEFPLKDIRRILQSPDFDREKALRQQTELLKLRREHIDRLIAFAEELMTQGGTSNMGFSAFDREKLDRYAEEAKRSWGDTDAWREYESRAADTTPEAQAAQGEELMAIFAEFGKVKALPPEGAEAQALVRKLQDCITANYYRCTDEILAGLGQLYAAGGEMTENIDAAGGRGTAAFAAEAIRVRGR